MSAIGPPVEHIVNHLLFQYISLKILNTTFKWMDLEKNIPAESGMFIQMGGNSKDNLLENSTFYNTVSYTHLTLPTKA